MKEVLIKALKEIGIELAIIAGKKMVDVASDMKGENKNEGYGGLVEKEI